MDHFVEGTATGYERRAFFFFGFKGIAEGNGDAKVHIVGEAEEGAGLVVLINSGEAGADAQFPGGELHIRGGLPGIEHDVEAEVRVGGDEGDAEGGSGEMSGEVATCGEGFENGFVADSNEVPGLHVFGGLGAPPGVEDGFEGIVGEEGGVEFAGGAFGADGGLDGEGGGHFSFTSLLQLEWRLKYLLIVQVERVPNGSQIVLWKQSESGRYLRQMFLLTHSSHSVRL